MSKCSSPKRSPTSSLRPTRASRRSRSRPAAATHAYAVPTDNDTMDERNGSVVLTLLSGTDYSGTGVVLVSVTDNGRHACEPCGDVGRDLHGGDPDGHGGGDGAPWRGGSTRARTWRCRLSFPQDTASGITLQDDTKPQLHPVRFGHRSDWSATDRRHRLCALHRPRHRHRAGGHGHRDADEQRRRQHGGPVPSRWKLSTLASGEWTRSFTTVGGGGRAPRHGRRGEAGLCRQRRNVRHPDPARPRRTADPPGHRGPRRE